MKTYRWNYKKCFKNLFNLIKMVAVVVMFLAIVSFNPFGVI